MEGIGGPGGWCLLTSVEFTEFCIKERSSGASGLPVVIYVIYSTLVLNRNHPSSHG